MYCTATGILHSSKHSLLQHSNEYKMIPNLNQYKIVQSTCFIFWAIFVVRVNKHYEMSQHLIKTHSQVSIIHDEFVKCKSELLSVHTLNQLVKRLSYFSLNILQGLFILFVFSWWFFRNQLFHIYNNVNDSPMMSLLLFSHWVIWILQM